MRNDSKLRNKSIKNLCSKKYNLLSPKNNIKLNQKVFLATSLRNQKNNLNEKNSNSRYKNIDINSSRNNNKKILTPRYDRNNISKYIIKDYSKDNYKYIDKKDEKSLELNSKNIISEYNYIISLLDNILNKYNSYNILIKIKNFIINLISETNEVKNNIINKSNTIINSINSSYSHGLFISNEKRLLLKEKIDKIDKGDKLDKSDSNINNKVNKSEFGKKKKNIDIFNIFNKPKYENEIKSQYECDNNYLFRKIKKLYQRINELERKCRIEQLKYLFFIVEQEKKISEIEKRFDINKIPLDEITIEKMKELKCYPSYFKPEINEDININTNTPNIKKKRPPLSSTIRYLKNNNSFLRSRNKNKNNNNIKNKYSFDKEMSTTTKKNQSQIIFNLKSYENKKHERNNDNNISSKSKGKTINLEDITDVSEQRKQNNINYSKSVNHFFGEKNFFITHPKLNYIKNSHEKNHFQKLKTKEKLNGICRINNLLSNHNLSSKSQKSVINDFSNFINNSIVNIEKYKNYHNFINIENKFEEELKLKKKVLI